MEQSTSYLTCRNSFMTPIASVASAAGGSAYRELETGPNYELFAVFFSSYFFFKLSVMFYIVQKPQAVCGMGKKSLVLFVLCSIPASLTGCSVKLKVSAIQKVLTATFILQFTKRENAASICMHIMAVSTLIFKWVNPKSPGSRLVLALESKGDAH